MPLDYFCENFCLTPSKKFRTQKLINAMLGVDAAIAYEFSLLSVRSSLPREAPNVSHANRVA
jgi:hypothetical protein